MALSIKSEDADRLARDLAAVTGESITQAVTVALAERLERCRSVSAPSKDEELREIQQRAAKLKRRDWRPIDEVLGYNDDGTFE